MGVMMEAVLGTQHAPCTDLALKQDRSGEKSASVALFLVGT
jgi:hypothetical protein